MSQILEPWIPLTPLGQMAETDYDVVIVGTGAGGGAVLWRLCEQWRRNGKRIGVVEAGDLLLPTHSWNIPTLGTERLANFTANPKIFRPIGKFIPEYPGAKQVLALGGRTLFWGLASPRMPLFETAQWPVPAKEMDMYFTIAEHVMNVSGGYFKGSSFQNIMLRRLWENGYYEATDIPEAVDLQPTKYGEFHSTPAFSSISFMAYALNRRPFDLAVKARAIQVLVEKNKVVGVNVMSEDKKAYVLRTKSLVLSASALETPRILAYSGIQGRAIGHYLTNHSFELARGAVNTSGFPGILGALGILIPGTEKRPYQLQIQIDGPGDYFWYQQFQEKPARSLWELVYYGFGKVESRFENYVTLDPLKRDDYGVPMIQVRFSYSEKDQFVIHQMAEEIRQVSAKLGAALFTVNGQPAINLMPPGSDNHESGTCRMGNDPTTSATNPYGQIHGILGLYVADNSVLPSIGTANPTLTMVALAIRTADHIIRLSGH